MNNLSAKTVKKRHKTIHLPNQNIPNHQPNPEKIN